MERQEVLQFAKAMESELKENDYKGGWKDCDLKYLVSKLNEEVQELIYAAACAKMAEDINEVKNVNIDILRKSVLSEAADVGNIAMMIADICKALSDN